jgi:hypothetical protein
MTMAAAAAAAATTTTIINADLFLIHWSASVLESRKNCVFNF